MLHRSPVRSSCAAVVPFRGLRAPGEHLAAEPQPGSQPATKRSIRMPTDRPTLVAEERQVTGKAVSKLRRQGRLPAVVYGHGVPSANVTLDAHEFELLRRRLGANELIDLSVAGSKSDPVLIQDIQ